jgi:hypothetical protein
VTHLWPHLPDVVAAHDFEKIVSGVVLNPAPRHPGQVYGPVGDRVPDAAVQRLIDEMTSLATAYGYPRAAGNAARISFDRAAAPSVRQAMDITWADGGNRSLWSFTALVALPHLTMWRFGSGNQERWVASDLTRHTWARLWWQAVLFEQDIDLLNELTESDLNQLLERRSDMGGYPRLICALGRAVVETPSDVIARRPLIRDVAARVLRRLAFTDARALDDNQLTEMCRALTAESVYHLQDRRSFSTVGDTRLE